MALLSEELRELIKEFEGLKDPREDKFIRFDIYRGEELYKGGITYKTIQREVDVICKDIGAGAVLLLLCSKPSDRDYWFNTHPAGVLEERGFRVEVKFLEAEWKLALREVHDKKSGILKSIKHLAFSGAGVACHRNVDKCWDLACVSADGNLADVVKKFEQFSILLK